MVGVKARERKKQIKKREKKHNTANSSGVVKQQRTKSFLLEYSGNHFSLNNKAEGS